MRKLLLAFIGRDGLWHHASATKMRRYINGCWQYRPATQDEVTEYDRDRAW